MNANYPNEVDATILTGFSYQWVNVVPGFITTAELLPVPGLPIGYLHANSESSAAFLLQYAPYYDTDFFHQDFLDKGIITVGESVSGALGSLWHPIMPNPSSLSQANRIPSSAVLPIWRFLDLATAVTASLACWRRQRAFTQTPRPATPIMRCMIPGTAGSMVTLHSWDSMSLTSGCISRDSK